MSESTEGEDVAQSLNPELLALLVCPKDKADLRLEHSELVCESCGTRYPIQDGIPNMLVDEPE